MRQIVRQFLIAASLFSLFVQSADAVDFERESVPILLQDCAACHNSTEKAGNLDLLSREGILAPGDSELAAIAPGKLADSYLVERIEAAEMPPPGKGKPLTAQQIGTLKEWIATGAVWPPDRTLSPFEMTTDERAGRSIQAHQ